MPSDENAFLQVMVIPEQTALVVIAPPNVALSTIMEALKEVSANFPGSSVVETVRGPFPIGGDPKAGYVDRSAGRLEFKAKQSAEEFKRAQEAIKDALAARHIGIDSDE